MLPKNSEGLSWSREKSLKNKWEFCMERRISLLGVIGKRTCNKQQIVHFLGILFV